MKEFASSQQKLATNLRNGGSSQMKKGATFQENIEFLINAYKREMEQEHTTNEIEMIEAYIEELETLIEWSK